MRRTRSGSPRRSASSRRPASGCLLGGGVGHLSRKYGLAIDNIVAADVVLADGSFARASEDENADLFWAIRGGGGNFGVVTSLTLNLHPVSTVVAGPIIWPLDQAAEVLAWYREFLPAQPDEVNGFFAFLTVPPGPPFPEELHMQKVCAVLWCIDGSAADADAAARAGAQGGQAGARRRDGAAASGVERRLRRPLPARATSGTGAATTSQRSPTRRSSRTSSSARPCRRGSR